MNSCPFTTKDYKEKYDTCFDERLNYLDILTNSKGTNAKNAHYSCKSEYLQLKTCLIPKSLTKPKE